MVGHNVLEGLYLSRPDSYKVGHPARAHARATAGSRATGRDWTEIRDYYVTSDVSLAQLAEDRGIPLGTITKHAVNREQNGSKTWAELRVEFRDGVSDRALDFAGKTLADKRAKVADSAADVAQKALDQLLARLSGGELMLDRDLINAAKLAATVKIELADEVGAPIDPFHRMAELTIEELRRLADEG
jgi:hypothetical protein